MTMTYQDVDSRNLPCEALYGTGLAPAEIGQGRTWIEVDLGAIRANVAAICRAAAGREIMAVVKANAYGLGMVPVAQAALEAGAASIGVAATEEALALRRAGITAPVLVMGHSHPSHAPALVAADVAVAVYSVETAQALAAAGQGAGRKAKVHLKIDSGLCRVGVAPDQATEFAAALDRLEWLDVVGIFTHFSCADDADVVRTRQEAAIFQDTLAALHRAGHTYKVKHAAATAAFLLLPETWMDMIRIGLGLFGYYPHRELCCDVPFKPAVAFKTRVSRLRRVPAGTGIGYSHTYTTPAETLIATLPVGYADGLYKGLGNKGHVLIRGQRVPRVGSIAMDLSMVDAGSLDQVALDDEVVIIGRQGDAEITLAEVAELAGTSVEHIMTLFSSRPSRLYV